MVNKYIGFFVLSGGAVFSKTERKCKHKFKNKITHSKQPNIRARPNFLRGHILPNVDIKASSHLRTIQSFRAVEKHSLQSPISL